VNVELYLQLLAGHLALRQLPQAKFLWQRIPNTLKEETPELGEKIQIPVLSQKEQGEKVQIHPLKRRRQGELGEKVQIHPLRGDVRENWVRKYKYTLKEESPELGEKIQIPVLSQKEQGEKVQIHPLKRRRQGELGEKVQIHS
jgi:rRNA maturation protein Nop10